MLGGAGTGSRVLRGAAAIARLRPNIMHSHNPTSLQYGVLGKLVSGARLVFTDHRGIVRVPKTIEWLLTDAVVAVSKDTARQSSAHGVVDITVIYNGVDPPSPRRTRAAVRAALDLGEGPVALHVANFLPVKGHDILMRALAQVRDRGVRLTVVTAGDGIERAAVEAQAKQLGLGPEQVRFLGFRADVPDLLAAADLFVLPSRMEGLPLAVLEAMSHGLPIVTTRIGGNPEVVTDGEHGLLVPIEDPGPSPTRSSSSPEIRAAPRARRGRAAARGERVLVHGDDAEIRGDLPPPRPEMSACLTGVASAPRLGRPREACFSTLTERLPVTRGAQQPVKQALSYFAGTGTAA